MLFARINRSNPEKIFMVVRNSWTSTALANGYVVQWDFTEDIDGVGVTQPTGIATNLGNACAGVVAEAIGIGEYGLIQVYGYHAAVLARVCSSNDAIELGSGLRMSEAGGGWDCEGQDPNGTLNHHCLGFSFEAYTFRTSKNIKAFIKAL